MDFAISAPLAPDSGAREDDVRALKIALNRLGHYVPHVEDGMTGIPDRALFDALKSFQRREGLYPDGRMKPGDKAVRRLDALTNAQEDSDMKYVWRSVRDSKVRPLHAALDGQTFSMNAPSEDGHPGEAPNCRCWMEVAEENKNPYPDAISPTIGPFDILAGGLIAKGGIGISLRIIEIFFSKNSDRYFTAHGKLRAEQRGISMKEIQNAIKSAEKSGTVTTKNGKYGSSQKIYHGSNGVTVVVETSGKNAGKIVTVWEK